MRTVLGLDLSLTCSGWATWRAGQLATGRIAPKKMDGARRRRWIAEQVAHLADTVDVDPLLVIEGVPTHGAYNIVTLAELHGVVRDHLDGYRPAYMDPRKLKKWSTGNGNAAKDVVAAAAVEILGWDGNPKSKLDQNEAEAAWLGAVGRLLLGDADPMFTEERKALLVGVSWPEGRDVELGGVA